MSEPLSPREESPPVQLYCGNCGAPIPPKKHFCEDCLAPASLAVPQPLTPPEVAAEATAAQEAAVEAPPAPEPALEPTPAGPAGPVPEPVPEVSAEVTPGPEPEPTAMVPQEPTPVPSVVPIERPAAPAIVPGALPAPSPPAGRWPWMVLLVGGLLLGIPLLFFGCIFLFFAGEAAFDGPMTAEEFQLITVLCCIVPGLICTGLATMGGIFYSRRRRG